ncbi:LAQU0S12e02608g1_1 [Lachancea quebecensis]|uniref:LAQU0S12e02608g1_1 n=1 Tax=Lachancea quebecensis TaxID=1654605 RepID=A0A0P1KUI0_9SACH|nr:LAQU0S12e02608g1_1 [Lachancea quebecensis]
MNPDPNLGPPTGADGGNGSTSSGNGNGNGNSNSNGHSTSTSNSAVNTRIFDVYAGDASMPPHMMDVLACETVGVVSAGGIVPDEEDDTDSADDYDYERRGAHRGLGAAGRVGPVPLINTGRGQIHVDVPSDPLAAAAAVRHVHNRPARLDLASRDFTDQPLPQPQSQPQPLPQPLPHAQLPLQATQPPLTNTDIWSVPVENAFLAALRIILKKGTAKIKLKDRNYGRNELISLYIHHRVGEYRAKKQISSHIQVWKKSILNKLQNGTQITDYERELLDLIEHGPPQTPENERAFHAVFSEILEGPLAASRHSSSVSTSSSASPSNIPMPLHDAMISPHGAAHGAGSAVMTGAPTAGPLSHGLPHGLPHITMYDPRIPSAATMSAPPGYFPCASGSGLAPLPGSLPGSAATEPLTPLEYARRVYGKLRSFKCVPVNMHDYTYPYTDAPSAPAVHSDQQTLQAAQEVAAQQRLLIQNLYSSQHIYGPVPPPDFGTEQPEYSGYDRHSFVPPNAAQPPEQALRRSRSGEDAPQDESAGHGTQGPAEEC